MMWLVGGLRSIWGGGGGPSFEIDHTTTDGGGNFVFNFDFDDKYAYTCTAEKALYFNTDEEFSVDDQAKEGVIVEVELLPIAYLQLHIVHTTPFNEYDEIATNGITVFYIMGDDVDTTIIASGLGNYDNQLTWGVTENAITETFSEYIYCPSFDTTFYEIDY